MTKPAGTFRVADSMPVAMKEAKAEWVPLAREALIRVARVYLDVTSYGVVAEEVQERSGIRTRQQLNYWIGDVLGAVGIDCHHRGEPLLSSLCLRANGDIGPGYEWVIRETYGEPIPYDLAAAASKERLLCYRHFGAELPPDGGTPAPTRPVLVDGRERSVKLVQPEVRAPVCPTCFLALPKTGQCDNCSKPADVL